MPKKPSKKTVRATVVVNGNPIELTLYSPRESKKTWYVYWKGLVASRSTGQTSYDEALRVAEAMVRNGGKRPEPQNVSITDAEFIEVQKQHFGKSLDPKDAERAQRTLVGCLEAIEAFRLVTGIEHVASATPDDCERFQHAALKLPSNWRRRTGEQAVHGDTNGDADRSHEDTLSPSTIVKWSTALRAAFERANRNAGKKCVRGVIPNERLLSENPWKQFTWIKRVTRKIRHFSFTDLASLLDWFDANWSGVTVAPAYIKVMLWSWARRSEVSELKWSDDRSMLSEYHFKSIGKRGVTKWFRIPSSLRQELESIRCESDYVFGDYSRQLREFHLRNGNNRAASQVSEEFSPVNLGDWMYHRVSEWSENSPNGSAYLHIFRKTGLQLALSGEHAKIDVANDASITPAVMATSYAQEFDEELWHKSNRTYRRIRASLPLDVAVRYGYEDSEKERLIEALDNARMKLDWIEIERLANRLTELDQEGGQQ